MCMPNLAFLQIIKSFYRNKFLTYIKLCKLRGPSCHDINVTCIWSPKDDLLKSLRSEFFFSLFYIWKREGKVFGNKTVTLWHSITYMFSLFVFCYTWQLWLIAVHEKKVKDNILCIVRWPISVTAKPKTHGKTKKLRQNKNLAAKWKIWRQNRKARANTVFGTLSKNIS